MWSAGESKTSAPPASMERLEPAVPVSSGVRRERSFCTATRPVPSPSTPRADWNVTEANDVRAMSPLVRRRRSETNVSEVGVGVAGRGQGLGTPAELPRLISRAAMVADWPAGERSADFARVEGELVEAAAETAVAVKIDAGITAKRESGATLKVCQGRPTEDQSGIRGGAGESSKITLIRPLLRS